MCSTSKWTVDQGVLWTQVQRPACLLTSQTTLESYTSHWNFLGHVRQIKVEHQQTSRRERRRCPEIWIDQIETREQIREVDCDGQSGSWSSQTGCFLRKTSEQHLCDQVPECDWLYRECSILHPSCHPLSAPQWRWPSPPSTSLLQPSQFLRFWHRFRGVLMQQFTASRITITSNFTLMLVVSATSHAWNCNPGGDGWKLTVAPIGVIGTMEWGLQTNSKHFRVVELHHEEWVWNVLKLWLHVWHKTGPIPSLWPLLHWWRQWQKFYLHFNTFGFSRNEPVDFFRWTDRVHSNQLV